MLNEMKVTVEMKRLELCDLMLACSLAAGLAEKYPEYPEKLNKWHKLHDSIKSIIDNFDHSQGY